jgi:hypothetical protein
MNEFLLLFRRDYKTQDEQPTPEQLETHLQHWQEWFEQLAEKGTLARKIQRWDGKGRVITQGDSITDGPYAEIKESIGGMIIIYAESYRHAEEISMNCPIFELNGSVEIRMGS